MYPMTMPAARPSSAQLKMKIGTIDTISMISVARTTKVPPSVIRARPHILELIDEIESFAHISISGDEIFSSSMCGADAGLAFSC